MTDAANLPQAPRIASATTPAVTPRWKIVLLQLIVLYLLGIRLWFDVGVTPMGDEAYYWMWGQHLSWSYFDHPPLNGWLQGTVAALFGWSNFTVRLTTWLTLAGEAWIFWLWSKVLAPNNREGWFWHTLAIFLTIPTVVVVGGIAFHDHLLIFFVLASLYTFHRFVAAWEDGRATWRWLYAAAALLGLATLSKYNGVFLGVGYAVWVLARPRLRPLLLTPHLWLAALLAVAIQAPVLYWNLSEGMASLRFHFGDRPTSNWTRPRLGQIATFLAVVPFALSPVLAIAAFRLWWLKPRSAVEGQILSASRTITFSSLVIWAVLAAYVEVYFHWNVVGYVALAPVAYRLIGGRVVLLLHLAFGLFIATVGVLTYTVTPIKIGPYTERGAPANYGWAEVAAEVATQQAAHSGAFLGAARYTYAAQLGFMLRDTEVAAFNPVRSQNDYWWPAADYAGKDAIILTDRNYSVTEAQKHFASMERLERVPVTDRLGKRIWTFEIWLGKSYTPAAP